VKKLYIIIFALLAVFGRAATISGTNEGSGVRFVGTVNASRNSAGLITYTLTGIGYRYNRNVNPMAWQSGAQWYGDGPEGGTMSSGAIASGQSGSQSAQFQTNIALAYDLVVSVAVGPDMWGGGHQACASVTIHYDAGQTGEGNAIGPNGDRLLIFGWTNNTGNSKLVGIYGSDGFLFGTALVPNGGSYNNNLSVSPNDSRTFQLVSFDSTGFSNSPDNPSGKGYLSITDTNRNGSYTDFVDGLSVPSQYTSTLSNGTTTTAQQAQQSQQSYNTSTSSPPSGTPSSTTSTVTVIGPNTTISGNSGTVGPSVTGPGTGTGGATEGTLGAGLAEVNTNLRGIKAAIIAQGPNGGGSGSGTTVNVNMSGVETRLDTANATLNTISEKVTAGEDRMAELDTDADSIRDHITQAGARNITQEAQAALVAGEQAGTSLRDSAGVSAILGVANSNVSGPGASSVSLPIQLQGPILVGGFGATIDLSPTQSNGAQAKLGQDWSWFLSWVKHFIAATAVIWFCKEAIDAAKQACYALGATPQHQVGGTTQLVVSSTIFGTAVGMPVAAPMWGLSVIAITASIIAAPTLIAAGIYTFANVAGVISSFGSSVSSLAQAAGSGAPGVFSKVFGLCNAVCPVPLLLVIGMNRLLLSISSMVQFVALHVGIKLMGML
jgi:hypothetical protein